MGGWCCVLKRSLWVQCGKRIRGCRSGCGSSIVPGKKENVGLARGMTLVWGEMGAIERYLGDKRNLGLLIVWTRGMWERKVRRMTLRCFM